MKGKSNEAYLIISVLLLLIQVNLSYQNEEPKSNREALREGVTYLHQHKYEEAADFFEEYIKQHPRSPAAHSNLGLAYWNLNKFPLAFYASYRAIELGSNSGATHTNFAGLLCTIYPRWSTYQPSVIREFRRRGITLSNNLEALLTTRSSEDIKNECERQYRMAMAVVGGERRRPLLYFAQHLFSFGDYNRAIEILFEVMQIRESKDDGTDDGTIVDGVETGEVCFWISKCYKELNEIERAVYWAKESTKRKHVEAGWMLVELLCEAHNFTEASMVMKSIGDSLPTEVNTDRFLYYQGQILSLSGHPAHAILSFTEIIDNYAESEYKGLAYRARGLEYNAKGEYKKVWGDIKNAWKSSHTRLISPSSSCSLPAYYFLPSTSLYNPSSRETLPDFIHNFDVTSHFSSNFPTLLSSFGTFEEIEAPTNEELKVPINYLSLPSDPSPSSSIIRSYSSRSIHLISVNRAIIFGGTAKIRGSKCEKEIVTGNRILTLEMGGEIAPIHKPNSTHAYAPIIHVTSNNYYHYLLELLPKFALLHHLEQQGLIEKGLIVVRKGMDEIIDRLGIERDRTLLYTESNQYRFKHLHFVDWFPDPFIEGQNEIQDVFYPPKSAYALVKNLFAPVDLPDDQRTLIIYTRRSPPINRHVLNDQLLIDRLRNVYGDNVIVFEIAKNDTQNRKISKQAELFQKARVVIGPHGASLTNMVFTAPSTPLIEFRTRSQTDNYFAHLCAATNRPYYSISNFFSNYDGHFEMTAEIADHIVLSLSSILPPLPSHTHLHDEL